MSIRNQGISINIKHSSINSAVWSYQGNVNTITIIRTIGKKAIPAAIAKAIPDTILSVMFSVFICLASGHKVLLPLYKVCSIYD